MPSAQESERGISRYPYNAPFERVAKIKAGLKTLALCMTKMQTKGLMGAPDFSEKGPGEKWRGSNWVYYVSKHSERMNLNDSTVEVFFDTADRVQWIAPSRVEGAKELGSPEKKCI